jgi:hypothetical protein
MTAAESASMTRGLWLFVTSQIENYNLQLLSDLSVLHLVDSSFIRDKIIILYQHLREEIFTDVLVEVVPQII